MNGSHTATFVSVLVFLAEVERFEVNRLACSGQEYYSPFSDPLVHRVTAVQNGRWQVMIMSLSPVFKYSHES